MPRDHPQIVRPVDRVSMSRLRGDLGEAFAGIAAIESWPQRALAIFRHMGFNEIVFHRAGELLANVGHFESGEATGQRGNEALRH